MQLARKLRSGLPQPLSSFVFTMALAGGPLAVLLPAQEAANENSQRVITETMTEELKKLGDLEFDIRVAASDAPVTATPIESQDSVPAEAPSEAATGRVRVRFRGPLSVSIGWETGKGASGSWAENQVTAGESHAFAVGHTYRIKVRDGQRELHALLHIFPDAAKLLRDFEIPFDTAFLSAQHAKVGSFRQIIFLDKQATHEPLRFALTNEHTGHDYDSVVGHLEGMGDVVAVVTVGRYDNPALGVASSERSLPPRIVGTHTWGLPGEGIEHPFELPAEGPPASYPRPVPRRNGDSANRDTVPQKDPALMKVLHLQYTQASAAARIIEQLFSRTGPGPLAVSVAVEERLNALVVRGDPDVLQEIEALLLRLDTPGDKPESRALAGPFELAQNPFDLRIDALKGPGFRSSNGTNEKVLSFHVGFDRAGETAEQLRKQYNDLEGKTRQLAGKLRAPLPDPASGDRLQKELRDAVERAFAARQKLQRAELAEFTRRLKGIAESIEMREKISEKIIDRRVDELLDPNLHWDKPSATKTSDSIDANWSIPHSFSRNDSGPPSKGANPTTRPGAATDSAPGVIAYVPGGIDSLQPGSTLRPELFSDDDLFWHVFGARFAVAGKEELEDEKYRGGLRITDLRSGGPAELAGLRVGDVVVGVDHQETTSMASLNDAWQKTVSDGPVKIYVLRDFARGTETLYAHLKWAKVDSVRSDATPSGGRAQERRSTR